MQLSPPCSLYWLSCSDSRAGGDPALHKEVGALVSHLLELSGDGDANSSGVLWDHRGMNPRTLLGDKFRNRS